MYISATSVLVIYPAPLAIRLLARKYVAKSTQGVHFMYLALKRHRP
jgi:hypothetical protein